MKQLSSVWDNEQVHLAGENDDDESNYFENFA